MGLRGKKILVFGLARSGAGAVKLLSELGCEITVTDIKKAGDLGPYISKLPPGIKKVLGSYPESINGTELVVVSPGVPLDIEPLIAAKKKGIRVIGELELAYQLVTSNELCVMGKDKDSSPIARPASGGSAEADNPSPSFLAVTGTNGKSTTTTLLNLMMEKSGFKTMFGGNIGDALSGEIYKQIKAGAEEDLNLNLDLNLDFIVAEVSSFQLESIDEFKPAGAAVLNITPDHLDRYRSLEEYVAAKARIFMNQDEGDFLVLNADDETTLKMRNERLEIRTNKPDTYYFSRKNEVRGAYFKDGNVFCNLPSFHSRLINADEIRIKGVHNLENAMASSVMALLAGCPPESVREVLAEFPGLEHRMEFVREISGVKYINDSKGTNVDAVLKSLEGFSGPVILIAGGRDKAGNFSVLRPLVKQKVKDLILIGEAAGKMKYALGDVAKTLIARDMKEAVDAASKAAAHGDVVLLSPACASFDMFSNFEDRGKQFKEAVMELH